MTKHIRTAASMACGILFTLTLTLACGGKGPTDPGQGGPTPPPTPAPPSGAFDIKLTTAKAQCPPVDFRIATVNATPNGYIELHHWQPAFDYACDGCQEGEVPVNIIQAVNRLVSDPAAPLFASADWSGYLSYGDHRLWALDLATGAKSSEVVFTVLRTCPS
jgi:hypothetical protein